MKLKSLIPYILAAAILTATVLGVGYVSSNNKADPTISATIDESKPEHEMRGVWVTYMTLDIENEQDKEEAFCKRINNIISDVKKSGMNTIFVHVRPFCDAIYKSRIYPWSHILTGNQGQDPGYDPLKYIIQQCRSNNIKIHAWLNPYRVSTQETPASLCDDNPYVRNKSLGMEINGSIYLNPASEDARQLIVSGIIELLENYDLDGIQFDDYFYPEDFGNNDKEEYKDYCESVSKPLSIEDYRKDNVNKLIKAVYKAVHSTKKSAVFGISPQGNLGNNDYIYADVREWYTKSGYVDYICPQLYFSLDNPALGYEASLNEWLELKPHKGLKLYVGLAGYKAGTDSDDGTWLDNNDILKTEIDILRSKGASGFILYSYDSLKSNEGEQEINNVINYLNTSPTQ